MANLLIDKSLTSVSVFGGTFADITGFSQSVTVAGTGSVVILMMSVNPQQEVLADASVDFRFTSGGSQVGPIMTRFLDTNSELNGATMMFALTGLAAGSHTFAGQARNRIGDANADVNFVRTFQAIEIESGASILVDKLTTVSNASPVAYANVTNLSDTQTPTLGSILLFLATTQLSDTGTDKANDFRFAIDGTRAGPEMSDSNDNTTGECNGVSMAWAETGVSAASHTFSLQWQRRLADADMDTGRERTFQVIEFTADADLLVDVQSVSADSAGGSYTDQTDMVGSPDIDSVDSIALTLWNYTMAGSDDDQRTENRFEIGGVQEGAEISAFTDAAERSPGCLMARAVTGESGVTDFAGQWIIGKSSPATDTGRPRTFQVIELLAAGIQASGAPSITKPTSTGNAIVKKIASGAPSINKPTSTGNAIRKIVASGAPSINKPTSQGNALVCRQASGAPSITKPTSTGNAIVIPVVVPDEPGSTVHKYGREEQYRERLEIEDEEILAIVIAATTSMIDEMD